MVENKKFDSALSSDAVSKTEATQLAKHKFFETQGLSDPSDHADRMQVKEGDFPS